MRSARQVALLRGINLAGRNRVDMAGLRELLGELGYVDVRTYLQSGNAVLSCPAAPETVAKQIEERLQSRYGKSIRVIVRSREELAEVVRRNPFAGKVTDGRKLHVNFLSAEPEPKQLKEIDPKQFEPDRFDVRGRELPLAAQRHAGHEAAADAGQAAGRGQHQSQLGHGHQAARTHRRVGRRGRSVQHAAARCRQEGGRPGADPSCRTAEER